MAKPKVFVGSSSESLDIAEAVRENLDHDYEVTVWTQGIFELMQDTVESLEQVLTSFDFGLFVFSADDVTRIRGTEHSTARDNVVFELGLFIGRLGRDRAFVLTPRGSDIHLPSDLIGLTTATYEADRSDNNRVAAVGAATAKVKRAMAKKGALERPSSAQTTPVPSKPEPTASPRPLPSPTWSEQVYEMESFFAIYQDDPNRAAIIDAEYRKTPFAATPSALALWNAKNEFFRMRLGKGGSIDTIRAYAADNPGEATVQDLLGRALSHYGDDQGAIAAHLSAAELASSGQAASVFVIHAISAAEQIDQPLDPVFLREIIASKQTSGDLDADHILALERIAKLAGLPEVSLALAERHSALAPADTSHRFDVAYQYSELGHHELSLLHYDAIPEADRDGGVWNNIGVAFNQLSIPGKAVDAYKRGEAMGDTMSSSNLANKLRAEGFFHDAQKTAEAAMSKPEYSPQVVAALDALRVARQNEDEADALARSRGRKQQGIFSKVGAAAVARAGADIEGVWRTELGDLTISKTGPSDWLGTATFEEKRESLFGLLGGPLGAETRTVELRAMFRQFGDAFQITWTRKAKDETSSILTIPVERKLVGLVEAGRDAIMVWDLAEDLSEKRWTRVGPACRVEVE